MVYFCLKFAMGQSTCEDTDVPFSPPGSRVVVSALTPVVVSSTNLDCWVYGMFLLFNNKVYLDAFIFFFKPIVCVVYVCVCFLPI